MTRSATRLGRTLILESLEHRSLMAADILQAVPELSSRLGAPHAVFLDFDGHTEASWIDYDSNNRYRNIQSSRLDRDGQAGFDSAEISLIKEVWRRVADDFSPFDVNVTTVQPAAGTHMTRVVIGSQHTAEIFSGINWIVSPGNSILPGNFNFMAGANHSGNVSIVGAANVWMIGQDIVSNVAYVFADMPVSARGMSAEQIANTAAHEAGHAFGLRHDQDVEETTAGSWFKKNDYDPGSDPGTGQRLPLMGNNLRNGRSVWTIGDEFESGQYRTQDQVAELTRVLGARPDDFGHAYSPSSFHFQWSYKEMNGQDGTQTGFISTNTDVDAFRFTSKGGSFSIDVLPVANGNLDAKLTVYRELTLPNGTKDLITIAIVNPIDFDSASFRGSLGTGTYIVAVAGAGAYGDLGQYSLRVTELLPGKGKSDSKVLPPPAPVPVVTASPATVGNGWGDNSWAAGGATSPSVPVVHGPRVEPIKQVVDNPRPDAAHLAYVSIVDDFFNEFGRRRKEARS